VIRKEDHGDSEVEASVDAETLAGGIVSALPARPLPTNFLYRIRKVLRVLGPGLVTGAADDDPSGIATYSQVGAQFGFSMLWTMLFIFPFMAAIQEISARLGRITGRGVAGNIRCFYSSWLLYGIVALLLFANIVNIGADIGAMGAAANLLVGGPTLLYCILFTTISVLLQIFVPYKIYSRVLKWLTLSLFAYVGTMFVVQIPWRKRYAELWYRTSPLSASTWQL
jgi:NRAMP (natural resistance-associated macrophage protein)-like metal ion transporter